LDAYQSLEVNADPKHIRAVVILSDGADTASQQSLAQVLDALNSAGGEGGNAIKLFTIAYGSDASTDILSQLAEITGGKLYSGDPATINQVYAEIALFF
jgi:Ca-activated chloride channel family protein